MKQLRRKVIHLGSQPVIDVESKSDVVAGGANRSAHSTKSALDEIRRRKAKDEERRRAIFGLVGLLALATTVRMIRMGGRGGVVGGGGVMNIFD